ncbi:MAG: signal peptidase II [Deltaproteobacteria bacterium]
MINTILIMLIIGIDQYTKYLAVTYLQYNPTPVIQGVFELNYVQNRGAAFGIMQNSGWLFFITIPIILGALFVYILLNKNKKMYQIPLILITSGAIGNYIDRVRFGYVIDFLDFKVWPVFNIADTAIVVGAVLFALIIIIEEKRQEDQKNGSAG